MTIGEFLTQYAGAFFGFLGAALAAGLACVGSAQGTGRPPASPVRRAPACWPRTPPSSPSV